MTSATFFLVPAELSFSLMVISCSIALRGGVIYKDKDAFNNSKHYEVATIIWWFAVFFFYLSPICFILYAVSND